MPKWNHGMRGDVMTIEAPAREHTRIAKTNSAYRSKGFPCRVEDCDKAAYVLDLCTLHYQRWRRHGDTSINRNAVRPLGERLWEKVNKTDTCWLWTGAKNPAGYGIVNVEGVSRLAHRVAYELIVGPIPFGLGLDHLCRTRDCVRPDHLEPVTSAVNSQRGMGGWHQRVRTHCPKGHLYNDLNTRWYQGRRYCRACRRTGRPVGRPRKAVAA